MPGDTPRKRAMPLVPQPFSGVSISRTTRQFRNKTIAENCGNFLPNLDTKQYRETLSEKKQSELDKRADVVGRRAQRNQNYKVSESCWEVSTWNDVFGLLYDDERFLIDKRPYEFLETRGTGGEQVVKRKIPDATIGLRSYTDADIKHGYACTVDDCEEDHSTMQPDQRLSRLDLEAMVHNPECGLVVDGVWGEANLLFPFAVYEAKKKVMDYLSAEAQIYHACRNYLAMLDDLARNPDNVAEYQTEESSKHQIFAFASCGPYWQVFVVWNFLNDCCTVETIWEGNVQEYGRAYDLICIVDQIQDFAANQHRPFVMKHLEAWHARHQKTLKAAEVSVVDSNEDDDNLIDFDEIASPRKLPEWCRLKVRSQGTRQEKANATRKRNRSLLENSGALQSAEEPQRKRPRGHIHESGVAGKASPEDQEQID